MSAPFEVREFAGLLRCDSLCDVAWSETHGREHTAAPVGISGPVSLAKLPEKKGLKTKTPRQIVEAHFPTRGSVSHYNVLSRAIFNFFADFLTTLCFQEHSLAHPPGHTAPQGDPYALLLPSSQLYKGSLGPVDGESAGSAGRRQSADRKARRQLADIVLRVWGVRRPGDHRDARQHQRCGDRHRLRSGRRGIEYPDNAAANRVASRRSPSSGRPVRL